MKKLTLSLLLTMIAFAQPLSAADKKAVIFFHEDPNVIMSLMTQGKQITPELVRRAGGTVFCEERDLTGESTFHLKTLELLDAFLNVAKHTPLKGLNNIVNISKFTDDLEVDFEDGIGMWIISFGSRTITMPKGVADVRIIS